MWIMWIPCDQILLLCDCSVCFGFGCAIHLFTMYLFIRSSAPNVFENESKSFSSPSGRHWNIWFEIKVFILFVYFKCIHLQRWWCLHWTKFHLVIINVVTTVWVKFHSHHNTNNTWIGCSDFPLIQMMKPFFNCKFTVSLNIWIVSLSLFIYWMAKIGANQFHSIPFRFGCNQFQPRLMGSIKAIINCLFAKLPAICHIKMVIKQQKHVNERTIHHFVLLILFFFASSSTRMETNNHKINGDNKNDGKNNINSINVSNCKEYYYIHFQVETITTKM